MKPRSHKDIITPSLSNGLGVTHHRRRRLLDAIIARNMDPIGSSDTSASSPLLQLPREIRDLIYEYALIDDNVIALESAIISTSESPFNQNQNFYKRLASKFQCHHIRTHRRIWSVPTFDLNVAFGTQDVYNTPKYVSMTYQLDRRYHSLDAPNVSMLQTNKQIHVEASELLYGRATFSFNGVFALATAFAFLCDRSPAALRLINRIELSLSENSNMCGTSAAHYPITLRSTDSSVLQYAYNHYTDLCTLLSSSSMCLRHISLRINSNSSSWRQNNTPKTAEEWLSWEEKESEPLRSSQPVWIEPLLRVRDLGSIRIYWESDSLRAHRLANMVSMLRKYMLKSGRRSPDSEHATAEARFTFRVLEREDFSSTRDIATSLREYTLHEKGTWSESKCYDEHWARETFHQHDVGGYQTRCRYICYHEMIAT